MKIVRTQAAEDLTSLSELIDQEYGAPGTKEHAAFEAGYETCKLGVLLQQARQVKGLTQAQLAELPGTDKSYISKLENELEDVRLSTLQRIIADGLGGHLEF